MKNTKAEKEKSTENAITLVALVVTIVVLLILAGMTITYVIGDNSIFKQASEAKLKTDIASWQEKLELAKNPILVDNLGTIDKDAYFEYIEKLGYIEDKNTSVIDNEDGTYDVTTKPGYVFLVELIPTKENPKDIKIEYIGEQSKLAPKIRRIEVTNKSSNSITVKVTVERLNGGKLSYYYKKEEEGTYRELEGKQNTTDLTATYTGLEQNKIYHIKIVAKNKEGTSEAEVNVLTRELETGIIRQKGETVWNSNKASIELETTNTNLTLKYQIGAIEENGWIPYNGPIGNLDHEDIVYAVLTDGTNYGEAATIEVRDGTAPTVTVTKGTVTTNSIAVTANAIDGEWGMPTNPSYSYFIKKSSETTYPAAKYTGTNTSYTFTGLLQNTSYDIKVTVKDKAQNEGTGILLNTTTGTVGGATGNLATGNIIASSPTWSGGKASITLSTTSGLQIQWQKNGISGTWTTGTSVTGLSHNNTVYARLWDGTNAGSEASVTIKDGTPPTNATITLGATTANTGVNVTATVTHNDAQSGPKIASCKWVYNTTAGKIGTTASLYTGGTFSSNGQTINLKATAPGTYYLHVLTTDNGNNVWETVSSPITVKQLATGITVSPTIATIVKGATQQLTATVTPTNTSNKAVTWTSNNTTVATVSNTGLVTAKAAGTATITVKTNDGSNKSATCTITVREPTVADIANQTQTTNKTTQDKYGNKITVPGGFKVVPNGTGTDDASKVTYTYNGDGTPAVQDGIVIEDGEGNQFVWIPVGNIKNKDGTTTTITLGRYTFDRTYNSTTQTYDGTGKETLVQNADNYTQVTVINSYFCELTISSNLGYQIAKNLGDFVSKTKSNGGYYLGRYEASGGSGNITTSKVKSKYNQAVWVEITQPTAAINCRNMYTGNSYVESDLVNSYAWDTAIVFIQKYSGNSNYANKKGTEFSTTKLNTGKAGDKVCNIHDMAANCSEWSTEISSFVASRNGLENPFVHRGGSYISGGYAACIRVYTHGLGPYTESFRPLCYVK